MLDTDHGTTCPGNCPVLSSIGPVRFRRGGRSPWRPGKTEADGVGVIEGLVLWLVRMNGSVPPGHASAADGIAWRPIMGNVSRDRMPWAPGKALSERRLRMRWGVSRSAFGRAVVSIGRETGLRNALRPRTPREPRGGEARG